MGVVQHGKTVIVTSIVFPLIAIVAVLLRLISKRFVKAGFAADDAWIVAAVVFMIVLEGVQIWSYLEGIRSTGPADPRTATYLKTAYIFGCFYYPLAVSTKLSILFYYRRIFNHPGFRKVSTAIIAVCVAWFISGEAPEILLCIPIRSFWDPRVPGTCLNYGTFWIIVMTAEVLIDLIIITLPLREIAKLQMSVERKILVSLIFLLGAFVIITGIIRMGLTYRLGATQIDIAVDSIWVNIHTGTAILCACLPTYHPLVVRVRTMISNVWNSYLSTGASRGSSNEPDSSENAVYPMQHCYPHQLKKAQASYRDRLERRGGGNEEILVKNAGVGNKSRDSSEDGELPIHGVLEERTVDMV